MTTLADDVETVVAQVREWLFGVDLAPGGDTVLLAGSLATALGNAASDIDLYVARRGPRGDLDGQQFFALGRRIDCHDVSFDELIQETDQLVRELAAGRVPAAATLTYLFRVCHGIPVSGEALDRDWVERCRGVVDAGVLAAGAALVREAWTRLEVAVELGSFPDHELACRTWEEAVMYAVLSAQGSSYPNQKWNWEKAALLPGTTAPVVARRSGALLRSAWPDLPDPDELGGLLNEAGVPVRLQLQGISLRAAQDVRVFELGHEPYVAAGGVVYRVSDVVAEVVSALVRPRTTAGLVDDVLARQGGARRRAEEAVCILLEELIAAGVVLVVPGATAPDQGTAPGQEPLALPVRVDVDALDATVVREGGESSWVQRQYAVWLAWVDYLSHGDDLAGALTAGQDGAAAAAARALAVDLIRMRAAGLGHLGAPLAPRSLALLRADLGQESRVFRALLGLATLGGDAAVQDLTGRVRALEVELVGHVRLALGGDLVTEEGHRQVFRYVRQLLDAADLLGVGLTTPAWVREKADRYGSL